MNASSAAAGAVALAALVLVPAALAVLVYFVRSAKHQSALLLAGAVAHLALTGTAWAFRDVEAFGGWLKLDPLGLVVLTLTSLLFLAVAHYAVGYLRTERAPGGRAFASCMLSFLAAASLVASSAHLALMWIGLETTTLSIAPLIYDRRDRRSLEAVWKYLVLSSVGIAFALLGVFLLATAQPSVGSAGRPLILGDMIANARALDPAWLRIAFVFVAIGFGTKMGLAPMHSWKPDTYGEAPSLVAGLMAGALTSCAFLGLARVSAVCFAAGLETFVRPVLLGFGLASLVVAAAFMVGQRDVRRMLAYSSVEHMGLLVLGLGVGGVGAYGAVLHALGNGLAKGLTFLAVGNVVLASGTSAAAGNRGLLHTIPATGALLIVGLLAVSGSPPFALFLSELTILSGAFGEHHPWIAAATLVILTVIFVGIATMILEMVYGPPGDVRAAPPAAVGASRERTWLVVAPAVLAGAVLLLGVYIPPPLRAALDQAAALLGGRAP